MVKSQSIGVVAYSTEKAQEALKNLCELYDLIVLDGKEVGLKNPDVDVVVALGGDGFMLRTMHDFMQFDIPIYGMNRGTTGFLANEYEEKGLIERIKNATTATIHPILMKAEDQNGKQYSALAINEVSLLRKTRQAAKLSISIDGEVRMQEMVCDGALVATPAGSSAYNFSVGGPIIPINAELIALTPISPFRPRRWGGALLPDNATIKFNILFPEKRPVNAVADFTEIEDVLSVEVSVDKKTNINLLFDPKHSLEERIIMEQFNH